MAHHKIKKNISQPEAREFFTRPYWLWYVQ